MKIHFNNPYMVGKKLWYIAQAHHKSHLAGAGDFTKQCQSWLEKRTGANKSFLTNSCTAALEMAAYTLLQKEKMLSAYSFIIETTQAMKDGRHDGTARLIPRTTGYPQGQDEIK